ncbi:hypothetical protein WOLCODRAFT_158026 [Wolfiporia cocos MD-104 SS10]|uniref:Uncharacterized protein n=1 Tax=Wolfiporia cocos (strain MD-104) TaxID=742152 RepID=A0A2H3J6N3_WOLCO|nr:hypothetical protein WOLCODRAFT_158026 [Wolfiporia cocos MD-104 SS10]
MHDWMGNALQDDEEWETLPDEIPDGTGQPPSSIRHSRKPQPPTPQRIQRKDGPRRIIAKATRRAPTSNGSAVCLNNRATSSAGRAFQGTQHARRKAASDAATASQAKAAARETSQRRTQQEKSEKTHLWERNAHVGLGQPRTRHHAQSGRSGHPSVTVPLA